MAEEEIEEVIQQIVFEHHETGEQIATLDDATGVDLPSVGDEIALVSVDFEEIDHLATTLSEEDAPYVVKNIKRRYAQATHTDPDPATVYQFSVIRILVEEAE